MSRPIFAGYGVAASSVVLVFLIKFPLESQFGPGPPLIYFVPAITFSSWYGGLGPGLLATALSTVLCVYFFFHPTNSLRMANPNDAVRLTAFLMEGVMTSVLMGKLHLALRRAEASTLHAEQLGDTLRQSEERLQAILDNSTALIYLKDTSGRFVLVNRRFERLVNDTPERIIGKTDFEVFPRETANALRANDRVVLATGRPNECEEAYPQDDGVHTYMSLKFPLADHSGVPFAIGCVSTDITSLKEAQRRALQTERLAAVGQMVAGLAHESRNALQRSQACLEMLALRLDGRRDAFDLVAGIQEAQDDLHRLYDEVRNFAAPILLDRRACRLSDVLGEAWDRLGTSRQGRAARLHTPGGPGPAFGGDHFRLVQVFRNIFENALGACHDPVEIVAEWAEAELGGQPAVRITLSDNGPGFTPEQRKNVFEPFFTTKTQGTGLGMAIARRIIEAHEGRIEVGPERGHGATIQITLPRGDE